MDPVIITNRLKLRHVTMDDIDDIQACIIDPRIYEMVAQIPANQTRENTEAWISTHPTGRDAKTGFVYAITRNNRFIGLIGLHRTAPSAPFEIGYWMSPHFWGKGFMTEAGIALLKSLEDALTPQKTISGYFADNPASGRVLEKLGYVQIDENEKFCIGRNKTLPHIVMERPAVRS